MTVRSSEWPCSLLYLPSPPLPSPPLLSTPLPSPPIPSLPALSRMGLSPVLSHVAASPWRPTPNDQYLLVTKEEASWQPCKAVRGHQLVRRTQCEVVQGSTANRSQDVVRQHSLPLHSTSQSTSAEMTMALTQGPLHCTTTRKKGISPTGRNSQISFLLPEVKAPPLRVHKGQRSFFWGSCHKQS